MVPESPAVPVPHVNVLLTVSWLELLNFRTPKPVPEPRYKYLQVAVPISTVTVSPAPIVASQALGTTPFHVKGSLQLPDARAVEPVQLAGTICPNARTGRANRQMKRVNLFMRFSMKLFVEIVSW
jgi:hypothetical protein